MTKRYAGKRALVLGASKWQVPLIRQAQSMGLEVVATDYDPNAVGFKVADYHAVVDILDADANTKVGIDYNIDAVMTDQTDYALNVVATVASRLVIPGPSEQVAHNCTNKGLMRKLTWRHGVQNPQFFITDNKTEARLAANDMGYPVVIKPTDNQGSRGVFKIDNRDQLLELFDISKKSSREGLVLIEEFIKGTEVTVEGFVADGVLHTLAISEKKHTPPPRIIAMNLDFPPAFSIKTIDRIKKTASDVASALGMKNGAYHGEFIVNTDGIFLVEAAHRGGGSGTSSHIVPAVSGVNILEQLVHVSMGKQVNINHFSANACTLKFLEFKPGLAKDISGLLEARSIPGVVLLDLNFKAGDTIPEVTDDSKRHGCIIVAEKTMTQVRRTLEQAVNRLDVSYMGTVPTMQVNENVVQW